MPTMGVSFGSSAESIAMTMTKAPLRTPAGEDELRHRTRKLGQRHRTVLLLIDARRSLDEVLNLAQQAGAAVGHFDELVKLGLVELPADAAPQEASPSGSAEASAASGSQPEPVEPDGVSAEQGSEASTTQAMEASPAAEAPPVDVPALAHGVDSET